MDQKQDEKKVSQPEHNKKKERESGTDREIQHYVNI